MILSEPVLFAFALIDNAALLFLLVYFVITLSDLECDYLNAVECCTRLNSWVGPKTWTHAVLTATFVLHGFWMFAILSLLPLGWLVYERWRVPAGNLGVYDPTEILSRDRIGQHLRDVLVYLAYYLIFFFIYLYCLIVALLKDDPIKRHHDDNIVTEL